MKNILIVIAIVTAHLSFGQTEEFNAAAQTYVNGDIASTKALLEVALTKFPKDKKLIALAEKVGIEKNTTKPTTIKVDVPIKEMPPKVVVVKDPQTEATKALLYKNAKGKFDLDIEKGEKLICMFSLTCGHCQEAYKDLCEMSEQGGLPKMFLYCFGQEFEQNYFFKQAGDNCKDAYVRTENYAEFTRLLEGDSFPRILAFKDGKLMKSWNIRTYNEQSVRDFYNIAKPEKEKPKDNKGIDIDGGNSGSEWGSGGFEEKKPWE